MPIRQVYVICWVKGVKASIEKEKKISVLVGGGGDEKGGREMDGA